MKSITRIMSVILTLALIMSLAVFSIACRNGDNPGNPTQKPGTSGDANTTKETPNTYLTPDPNSRVKETNEPVNTEKKVYGHYPSTELLIVKGSAVTASELGALKRTEITVGDTTYAGISLADFLAAYEIATDAVLQLQSASAADVELNLADISIDDCIVAISIGDAPIATDGDMIILLVLDSNGAIATQYPLNAVSIFAADE